jgi:predicted dehydrogenase
LEAEFHYDRYKQELSPKMHKETPVLGAGVVYDLGPHLIDQALVSFGFPEAVFADVRVTRSGSQVDDYFEILLYYPTLRVRLKSGYFYREPIAAFTLFGRKGSFHKSRADIQENALLSNIPANSPDWGIEPESERGLLHTEIDGKIVREQVPTEKGDYAQYYEGIYQHIRSGVPIHVTADDGIRVMKIITAALESSAEKRVIAL